MKENNKKRNTKVLSKRWFDAAERDLDTAQKLFKVEHFTDTICYHAHQAVEKYLKGFLVFNNVKPPCTHNLPKLLRMCDKLDPDFINWEDECNTLNKYYFESRYPPNAPIDYPRS